MFLYFLTLVLVRIKNPAIQTVSNLFCIQHTFEFFQYFVFGNLVARYKPFFEKLLNNSFFTACILLLFCFLFWFYNVPLDRSGLVQSHRLLWASMYFPAVLFSRYCSLLIVFAFFRKYQTSFSSATRLGTFLQYVGKRTLDIYLLHYFFLQTIPGIGDFLTTYPNTVLELFIGVTLSIMVIGICLILSNIIRTSDLLGHYLFGAKMPQKKKA